MARTLGLFAGCALLVLLRGCAAVERVYCIAIEEVLWDYAPSGKNLINGKTIEEDEHASIYLKNGPHRIGRVYKKALYQQYTNADFTHKVPRPDWLGFLGPIIRAEVGDSIVVHMKNYASRPYTIHPHGVFYTKTAEGAFYPDGTSKYFKKDDMVPPGGSYTYRWEVKPEYAPTDDDANCLTWIYHSHLEAPRDISSGLIGPLITCKKGTLKKQDSNWAEESARTDVDQDIPLFFTVVDENLSWYLKDNVQLCTDPAGVVFDAPDFVESNKMHVINGYTFGNLPGIELCQHRTVAWHMFGIGNEPDVHSASFHGNTLLDRGHRTGTINLFPATFITASMVPKVMGKWLLSCQVNDHYQAGMQAFYKVKSCDTKLSPSSKCGVVRNYYLAAEKVLWDYASSGKDLINKVLLNESGRASEVFFSKKDGHIGGVYKKAVFYEYTDKTFTRKKIRTPEYKHLGFLGPVLRAEQGDTLKVTFLNKADRSYSILPHGVQYDKQYQGTSYVDGATKPGSHVDPGERFTYIWHVLDGPSPSDPPCIPYMYYSAVDPVMDTNSGLVGPLLVCKKGVLGENKKQAGIDRLFFLLFGIMDENLSWYLNENIEMFGSNQINKEDAAFVESNKMHAVNGFMYGNLLGLDMCAGDNVVWYTFGLGSEQDIHGVYFEGNTFKKDNTTRDTVSLFAHTSKTFSMQPTTPGVFEVNCRTTDHFSAGMRQLYRVNYCPGKKLKHFKPSKTVQYFISAEEKEWDYSPSRVWELERFQTTADNSPGNTYVGRANDRIGPRYKKAMYRGYADGTFKDQKEQPNQEHLGILGPIICAEVGDTILITFKNKASRPYSISPHGVKANGAHVAVQPGHILELTWDVPESSGPGPTDPNCISYAYYSTVDFVKDLNSGLVGPLVICKRGILHHGDGPDRHRRDMDKEFALLFMIFDENQSWYLDDNIRHYLGFDPDTFQRDAGFIESNKKHGINGRLYGNLHGLEMTQGQKVGWYMMGMGNEADMHTAHFHAETFTYKMDCKHRGDVFDLFPGIFQEVEMVVGNPGIWFLHCHLNDHIMAGMETTYTIKEKSSKGSGMKISLKTLILGLLAANMHQ